MMQRFLNFRPTKAAAIEIRALSLPYYEVCIITNVLTLSLVYSIVLLVIRLFFFMFILGQIAL